MTEDIVLNVSTYLPYHNIYWYAEYSGNYIIKNVREMGRNGLVTNITGKKRTHTVIFLMTGEAILTPLSIDALSKRVDSAKMVPGISDIRITASSYLPYQHILWYTDCDTAAVRDRVKALQQEGRLIDLTGRKKRKSVIFLVTGQAILLGVSAKVLSKRISEAKHKDKAAGKTET